VKVDNVAVPLQLCDVLTFHLLFSRTFFDKFWHETDARNSRSWHRHINESDPIFYAGSKAYASHDEVLQGEFNQAALIWRAL